MEFETEEMLGDLAIWENLDYYFFLHPYDVTMYRNTWVLKWVSILCIQVPGGIMIILLGRYNHSDRSAKQNKTSFVLNRNVTKSTRAAAHFSFRKKRIRNWPALKYSEAIYCNSSIFFFASGNGECQHDKMFQFFYKWSKYFQLVQERDVRIGIIPTHPRIYTI